MAPGTTTDNFEAPSAEEIFSGGAKIFQVRVSSDLEMSGNFDVRRKSQGISKNVKKRKSKKSRVKFVFSQKNRKSKKSRVKFVFSQSEHPNSENFLGAHTPRPP